MTISWLHGPCTRDRQQPQTEPRPGAAAQEHGAASNMQLSNTRAAMIVFLNIHIRLYTTVDAQNILHHMLRSWKGVKVRTASLPQLVKRPRSCASARSNTVMVCRVQRQCLVKIERTVKRILMAITQNSAMRMTPAQKLPHPEPIRFVKVCIQK